MPLMKNEAVGPNPVRRHRERESPSPCSVETIPKKPHSARKSGPGLRPIFPHTLRNRTTRPPPAELMPWYQTLSRKGWIAPHWPKKYGGMGATLNEQIVMTEELAHVGAPQLPAQGLNHIGPILMEFAHRRRRRREHLPPIIDGSVIWAQGYSEPGAGSDLASLSTRADAARATVSWSTGRRSGPPGRHHSHWMFALVRTDPQAQPRHAGISFVLIDLHSPGITDQADQDHRRTTTSISRGVLRQCRRCRPSNLDRQTAMTAGASPTRYLGHERHRHLEPTVRR